MALSLNSFGSFLGKFAANQDLVTTAATAGLLDRTHYSSSGHSGGGYHHHHYSSGKKKKRSIALTALTLLSFLFFLNILQNCIQEHINQMNPTMIVMQMQTSAAATIRKADRKGDDGGDIYINTTMLENVSDPSIKHNFKSKDSVNRNDETKTDAKGTKKGESNQNKGRTKGGNRKEIKIKPTKATLYVPDEEYEYTQIPIKLKTVEKYTYNKKP